ncbi:hypothetical protein [Streptomyces clavuligerus]|uniref:hypothetical protein n=1 Tax=Streptomyces clavuligerus TaxID=1901 RepID=UPI0030B8DA84
MAVWERTWPCADWIWDISSALSRRRAACTPGSSPSSRIWCGHPRGLILFDTGIGRATGDEAHYRPRRRSLPDALSAAGAEAA